MEKLEKFGGQTPPRAARANRVELASIYVQLAAEDASYATRGRCTGQQVAGGPAINFSGEHA